MTTKSEESSVQIPLSEWARQIAVAAAQEVIKEHVATCSLHQNVADLKLAVFGNGRPGIKQIVQDHGNEIENLKKDAGQAKTHVREYVYVSAWLVTTIIAAYGVFWK